MIFLILSDFLVFLIFVDFLINLGRFFDRF